MAPIYDAEGLGVSVVFYTVAKLQEQGGVLLLTITPAFRVETTNTNTHL